MNNDDFMAEVNARLKAANIDESTKSSISGLLKRMKHKKQDAISVSMRYDL